MTEIHTDSNIVRKEMYLETDIRVHGTIWEPADGDFKMVLQIVHGMTEHIGRYERFAHELVAEGIVVAGLDLRGHGRNAGDYQIATWGIDGWKNSLNDIHAFYEKLQSQYHKPHVILGFSLGSFLLRDYLSKFPEDVIDRAIIMGTGCQPGLFLMAMKGIIEKEIEKVGVDQTSDLVRKLSFANYNKRFKPNRTNADWLCSDEKELDEYLNDPLCKEDISAGLFYDLLSAMLRTSSRYTYRNWRDISVLLLSGKMDPVGGMGKGVKKVYRQMEREGIMVKMDLIDGARHDILHEYESGAAHKVIQIILEYLENTDNYLKI